MRWGKMSALLQDGRKSFALDVFHSDEVCGVNFSPVVYRNDVRVGKRGRSLCFTSKALDKGGISSKLRE